MDCMDIAKAMVNNRVLNINYSIDNGCDGGINTNSIKLYYEMILQNIFTSNIYIKY